LKTTIFIQWSYFSLNSTSHNIATLKNVQCSGKCLIIFTSWCFSSSLVPYFLSSYCSYFMSSLKKHKLILPIFAPTIITIIEVTISNFRSCFINPSLLWTIVWPRRGKLEWLFRLSPGRSQNPSLKVWTKDEHSICFQQHPPITTSFTMTKYN